MTALLIAGGRVVDPVMSLDAVRDVRIRNGIVAEIGEHLEPDEGETVLDVAGAVVAPGFVDMHVHLREPGFPAEGDDRYRNGGCGAWRVQQRRLHAEHESGARSPKRRCTGWRRA